MTAVSPSIRLRKDTWPPASFDGTFTADSETLVKVTERLKSPVSSALVRGSPIAGRTPLASVRFSRWSAVKKTTAPPSLVRSASGAYWGGPAAVSM